MEKRVILAVVLSSMIFIVWQALFPLPQTSRIQKQVQHVENKELIEKRAPQSFVPDSEGLEQADAAERKQEEIVTIHNGKIEGRLTTRGGRLLSVRIAEYDAELPVTDLWQIEAFEHLDYAIERKGAREAVFVANYQGMQIWKEFVFSEEDFLIKAKIRVKNLGSAAAVFESKILAMKLDMSLAPSAVENTRDRNLLEYSVFTQGKVVRKTGAYKFTARENKAVSAPVDWFGFRNRYYAAIVRPEEAVGGYEFFTDNHAGKRMSISTLSTQEQVGAGEERVFSAKIYVGPQNARILKQYDMFFEKIQVYFRLGFFDAIAKIIEDLVIVVHKVVPNWGAAIILVSLLIFTAMYPFTMKSMLSMRKMQSLQPKIVELRTKYEKNPQKLNQEIMKLYAENKVNPVGGCLPVLLQAPVFICLYQMIWRSILFKGAGFLWIKDLSEPDRAFVFEQNIPLIGGIVGNELNILPLIITVLMVFQQKMVSKNMVVSDPNQLVQQKMMLFMMPAILLLIFYRIASGLNLYMVVFYLMSSFSQWRISKISKTVTA